MSPSSGIQHRVVHTSTDFLEERITSNSKDENQQNKKLVCSRRLGRIGCQVQVQVQVNLRPTVSRPGTHLGPVTNFFSRLEIFFRQLRVCYFEVPSLTRGRVCNLLYNCFWPLPEQTRLGRNSTELTAILYCLI
jgi:hypothetical protein